jgi:protein SCO1/2
MTRTAALLASAAVVVGLAIGATIALRGGAGDPFADCREGVVAGGQAGIGGPFALTAPDGRRVTEAEAITGPTLVYFGYGFCPDFCPTDLARNAVAADLLAERGLEVGQVFVSIDPARDTPEAVGAFAEAIHPDLLGLTGAPAEVDAAAKAYKVYYRKAGDDPEFYLMDHSTFTYLMAPGTGFLEVYRSDATPEAMADSVACFAAALPD